MKYTFQHYMDISTSANSMNIYSIRCGGKYVLQRCKHLFGAYKYFKLGKIKVKLVPASTLPVDPLGLSYQPDDPQTIDPRDQMNPGLVRITNGENLKVNLEGISHPVQEEMYTNTMLDPRWSKFMLQSGFQRYAVPLFWDVGLTAQTQWPGIHNNYPELTPYSGRVGSEAQPNLFFDNSMRGDDTPGVLGFGPFESSEGAHAIPDFGHNEGDMVLLGHRKRVGWLPTDAYEIIQHLNEENRFEETQEPLLSRIPSCDVITIVFPQAYKTLYYYRLFITETVYFKGIKNYGINVSDDTGVYEYRSIDNFTGVSAPVPVEPDIPVPQTEDYPYQG